MLASPGGSRGLLFTLQVPPVPSVGVTEKGGGSAETSAPGHGAGEARGARR